MNCVCILMHTNDCGCMIIVEFYVMRSVVARGVPEAI